MCASVAPSLTEELGDNALSKTYTGIKNSYLW
jgi:hypothetical protein